MGDALAVPAPDIASALLHQSVNGRALQFDEIVSILRNWTMGEVGTIAAAVGVWVVANRDPVVFDAPARCRIERDQAHDLLYGAGIHVCPGAALSRMQLRVVLAALLERTGWIAPDVQRPPTRATRPAAGLRELNVVIE